MKSKYFTYHVTILVFFLFLIFFLSITFLYKAKNSDIFTTNELIRLKTNYAKSIEDQKIIIASGSNSLFGIKAKLIEEEFDIPAVNLGVNSNLELDYILYILKKVIKNGDIVILPLEYRLFDFQYTDKHSYQKKYTFGFDKNFFFQKYDYKEYISTLKTISIIDLLKSIYLDTKYKKKKFIGNTININGDVLFNIGNKKINWDKPYKLKKNDNTTSDGFTILNNFKIFCHDNNITLLITFPNTIRYEAYENDRYKNYFMGLKKKLYDDDFITIGNPYDFMFDRKYFYNSCFHMNTEGVEKRTNELIDMLKKNQKFIIAKQFTARN